jgi:hypothetical protein
MKLLVLVSLGELIAVAIAEAANLEPQPTPVLPGEMEEPALPTLGAAPGDDEPSILPKPDELPVHRTERPARASSERFSTRPLLGEQVINQHEEPKAHEIGSTGPSKSRSHRSSSTSHSDPRNSLHVTKSLRSSSLRKSDHQSLRTKLTDVR